MVTKILAHLKAKGLHLLYLVPFFLLGLFLYHFLGHRADVATGKAQQAVAVLQQQKSVDAQQAVVVRLTEADYQAIKTAAQKQNAQLTLDTTIIGSESAAQQQADTTLPLTDLAVRLRTLTDLPSADVTATPSGLNLTPAGALAVVQKMDTIPALLASSANAQAIAANDQKQIAAQDLVTAALQQQVLGLNAQIADGQKVCATRVGALKATARRSKLRWLGAGVVLGIVITAGAVIH